MQDVMSGLMKYSADFTEAGRPFPVRNREDVTIGSRLVQFC
jgi:hypothetical protein